MRAYLIEPHDKEIREITHTGQYKDIMVTLDCAFIDAHMIDNCETFIWTGDQPSTECFWIVNDDPRIWRKLCRCTGRGLVLTTNDDGVAIDCALTLDYLKSIITFSEPAAC